MLCNDDPGKCTQMHKKVMAWDRAFRRSLSVLPLKGWPGDLCALAALGASICVIIRRAKVSFPGGSAGKESCNAGEPSSIPGSERSTGEGIGSPLQYSQASLVDLMVKDPPAMRETWVRSLGWKVPLETETATHCRILAWRIQGLYSPWGHKESDTTERHAPSRSHSAGLICPHPLPPSARLCPHFPVLQPHLPNLCLGSDGRLWVKVACLGILASVGTVKSSML